MVVSATVQTVTSAERNAILDAARIPVVEELGKPPVLVVRQLNRDGEWAFLFADMQQQGGAPFDYGGTRKAEAARQGFVSRSYAALLRKDDGGWRVVEAAIGPTDAAWEGWATKYGVPDKLFAFDAAQ
ncbi:hypothetical protein OK349_04740 [Sphingomonas sp. BT-65]|uniref:hypothetical protein n=1 Tax=Sphingomonas sp. BT-65 TaxID=2989821 RepID=UPI00223565E6|nr:hypothetical protein [Sphingomonas sp. BT-65]MCW4461004.1 hypothetical protein [Sphingomonas sp. BT-65]